MPRGVVEVTILKARMGEPSQGRRGTGGQTEAAMRDANCGAPEWRRRSLAAQQQDGPLESEVIRKRSRFVRLGATGKGPWHNGPSPVAYSPRGSRWQTSRLEKHDVSLHSPLSSSMKEPFAPSTAGRRAQDHRSSQQMRTPFDDTLSSLLCHYRVHALLLSRVASFRTEVSRSQDRSYTCLPAAWYG